MRFVWTVQGDDPDFGNGDRHGIDGYFWPMWDALTTRENLMDTARRGHAVGVYIGAGWHNDWSPAKLATRVHQRMAELNVPGLRVMFNLEEHDPERIAQVLEEWRSMKARRFTSTTWSMEPNQGGWMSPSFVQRILACRVRLVPQEFGASDMSLHFAQDMVLRDLTRRGFPESIVSLFYDARRLPLNWEGYAFTEGLLPR